MSAGNWYGDVSTFLCSWRYDTDLISHWSAFNPTHGPTKIFLVNPSIDSDDCPALCCLRHRPGRKMFLDLCRFSWFSNDFMFIFQHATKVFQHVSKFNFVHRCVVCPTGRVDKCFWTLDGGTPQCGPHKPVHFQHHSQSPEFECFEMYWHYFFFLLKNFFFDFLMKLEKASALWEGC